ncbi:MAG: MATE family efflux transporter [Clostridiales bacterium]|nr:MATE family efflux transporter [Clostridiales bacterium]
MTTGRPIKGLIKFSIPLLIGNFAQQLYNTVDAIVVGQHIGDSALAAVGTSGPIINLLLVLFMGISTGASILAAQFFGAKDRQSLNKVIGGALLLVVTTGLFMTVAGYFLAPALVQMVDPPDTVAANAQSYLQIIFLGIVGCSMYNILSGILRGIGDSVFPLFALIVASLLNIGLDLLFVANFQMGVAGVAWATIIAQGISAILCLIRLCTIRQVCDVQMKNILHPDGALVMRLCRLGLPAGITQAIFSMSALVVQGLTNSMGEMVMAASTAVMRVDGFAMMPNFTFGIAATTFVGQNIGARKADRIRQGNKDLLKLALGSSITLVVCLLLFGYNLLYLFTDTASTLEIGNRGLRILAFGYICFSVTQVLQGNMRGAGETMLPMWISIITTVIIRMPLAYLFAYLTRSPEFPNGHSDALYFSLLLSWVMGMVLSVIVYRLGWWRKRLPAEFAKEM